MLNIDIFGLTDFFIALCIFIMSFHSLLDFIASDKKSAINCTDPLQCGMSCFSLCLEFSVFGFPQFYYGMSRCGSLCICVSLSFFNTENNLSSNLESFSYYFFKIFSIPAFFSLLFSPTYFTMFDVPQVLDAWVHLSLFLALQTEYFL